MSTCHAKNDKAQNHHIEARYKESLEWYFFGHVMCAVLLSLALSFRYILPGSRFGQFAAVWTIPAYQFIVQKGIYNYYMGEQIILYCGFDLKYIAARRAWLFIEMFTFILNIAVLMILLGLRLRPCGGGKELFSFCRAKDKAHSMDSEEYAPRETINDKLNEDDNDAQDDTEEPRFIFEGNGQEDEAAAALDDQAFIKNRIVGAYALYLQKQKALKSETYKKAVEYEYQRVNLISLRQEDHVEELK